MANIAILLGNLGRDIEIRTAPGGGTSVASTSLATTWKSRPAADGSQVDHTEWHRLTFFGATADSAARYLRKGMKIYVTGRIHYGQFVDQTGVTRYTTEIYVDRWEFAEKRDTNGTTQAPPMQATDADIDPPGQPDARATGTDPQGGPDSAGPDDDLPF